MEGLGMILGSFGTALGASMQQQRTKGSQRHQEKLQKAQFKYQKQLNQQGADLQYDLWNKTNYPEQVAKLKEAGLNAGLLYGKGGAGGATTGSQTGGSAGSASTPQPMDIGQALNMGMMSAQIENIKADTEQKKAATSKTGEETQEIKYRNRVAEMYGLDADIYEASNRRDEALSKGQIMHEGKKIPVSLFEEKLIAEVGQVIDNAEINEKTKQAQIDDKLWEAANEEIEHQVKTQNIELSKQQERRLWHQIRQDWVKAGLQGLDTIVKGRLKDIGKSK